MGFLFSRPTAPQPPQPRLHPEILLTRAQYIGQPLALVLTSLRKRGIENILVALKSRDTWTPPAQRRSTGRVIVVYNADTLLVQEVVYE
jgi:hypothetical protein